MKYLTNTMAQLNDFVQIPRIIKNDYLNGKLTKNQFDALIWIWINANPVNGFYHLSYEGLAQDFRGNITKVNARQIISQLRKLQYIYFTNHRGRGGSFTVYPVNYKRTSGHIQTLDSFKINKQITTKDDTLPSSEGEYNHKLSELNHNFEEQKSALIKQSSMDKTVRQITTPYNDNDNKNNKYNIDNKNTFKKESSSFANKESEVIPVDGFLLKCKNWEQQKCWEIAEGLGETDMRFLLSCLKKYGFKHIERAWGIFKEVPQNKIHDKAKYFNKLIRDLYENK